jgi:hypothetical protein
MSWYTSSGTYLQVSRNRTRGGKTADAEESRASVLSDRLQYLAAAPLPKTVASLRAAAQCMKAVPAVIPLCNHNGRDEIASMAIPQMPLLVLAFSARVCGRGKTIAQAEQLYSGVLLCPLPLLRCVVAPVH